MVEIPLAIFVGICVLAVFGYILLGGLLAIVLDGADADEGGVLLLAFLFLWPVVLPLFAVHLLFRRGRRA